MPVWTRPSTIHQLARRNPQTTAPLNPVSTEGMGYGEVIKKTRTRDGDAASATSCSYRTRQTVTSVTAITVPDICAGSSWLITVWTVCTELRSIPSSCRIDSRPVTRFHCGRSRAPLVLGQCLPLAHQVISRQRSNSVAAGVKQTSAVAHA
jgi:hypothetical protein